MGADILRVIDPFRIASSATKAITGKSIESWTGINAAKDKAASSASAASDVSGDLTADETKKAGMSKLFRVGAFFTSPTGVLNSSSRQGAKLIGN